MSSTPMKVIFYESSDEWGEVLKCLIADEIIASVFWIGTSPQCNLNVHNIEYGKFSNYKFNGASRGLQELMSGKFQYFLDMHSRNYRPDAQNFYSGNTVHDELNIYRVQIEIFSQIIKENKIEAVIMSRLPHLGSDYVLYSIAKLMGLRFLSFQEVSSYPGKIFPVSSIEDIGRYNLCIDRNDIPVRFERNTEILPGHISRLVKDQVLINFLKIPNYFKPKQVVDFFGNLFLRNEIIDKSNYDAGLERQQEYVNRVREISMLPNLQCDYVYFALHLQPEQTTSGLESIYCDQLLAIESISSILPVGWRIIVKENPLQTHFMRGDWFYCRLLSIPNVYYVSSQVDSNCLCSSARLVATIGGTVGFEAICVGKPALIFGPVWYQSLPGVFIWENTIDVDSIINFNFNGFDLESSVVELFKKTFNGYIYLKPDGFDGNVLRDDFNIINLRLGISNCLRAISDGR
jgi:hypothetical protein